MSYRQPRALTNGASRHESMSPICVSFRPQSPAGARLSFFEELIVLAQCVANVRFSIFSLEFDRRDFTLVLGLSRSYHLSTKHNFFLISTALGCWESL